MILDRFRLDGRVALVTGAGKGIGEDIALALAEAGADVAVCARTQADVDDTAAKIEARGRRALATTCDVRETPQLGELVKNTLTTFDRLDVLVNNAGGSFPKPAMETSEVAFDRILRFNLISPFLLTKLVVPEMVRTAGGGAVVNISSGASTLVVPGLVGYSAAKAGLNQMTRVLAQELAPKVRVNAIVVGQIDTPGAADTLSGEVREEAVANVPLARLGDPWDVAACALFLASPASAWITGRIIAVDGGVEAPPIQFPIPPL